MLELKPISKDGVPAALTKAEHYRLLNEPQEAESICLDVLDVEPENQRALITLVLSLTDQFDQHLADGPDRARLVLARVRDDYCRAYYGGIVLERAAKAHHRLGGRDAARAAVDCFEQAMASYEEAEHLSPTGNDDAILRWNTCARLLPKSEELVAARD